MASTAIGGCFAAGIQTSPFPLVPLRPTLIGRYRLRGGLDSILKPPKQPHNNTIKNKTTPHPPKTPDPATDNPPSAFALGTYLRRTNMSHK